MNQLFYIEADEEITKVIRRMKHSEKEGIVFVVPRGSTIGQSLINLKLLKRSAKETGKQIALVSSDTVTKNLADKLSLQVFGKASDAERAVLKKGEEESKPKEDLGELKIKTYKRYDLSKQQEIAEQDEPEAGNQEDDQSSEYERGKDNVDQDEAEAAPTFQRFKVNDEWNSENEKEDQNAQDTDVDHFEEKEELETPKQEDYDSGEEETAELQKTVGEADDEHHPEHSQRPKDQIKKDEIHYKNGGSMKKIGKRLLLISILLIVLAGLAVSYVYLPRADVSLAVESRIVEKNLDVLVDRNQIEVDVTKMGIPGGMVELQKDSSKKYTATGKKDVGTKASGTITISNASSTAQQVLAPATRVVATDGKVFTLTKGVIVPGASLKNCQLLNDKFSCDTVPGTIEASVTALENGDQYNIAPTKFTVGKLSGESKAAFTGGVTQEITYITDDDLSKAELELRKEIVDQSQSEFAAKITDSGLKFLDKCSGDEIISQSADKKSGEESDSFTYTMRVKLYSIGFSEGDLRKISQESIKDDLAADEAVLDQNDIDIAYALKESDISNGFFKITAKASSEVGKKIDLAQVKNQLKNKNMGSAVTYLRELPGVTDAKVEMWPQFLTKLPLQEKNISVEFGYSH